MSQFCGYTLELVLNDLSHTAVKGVIKKIIDKDLIVSDPVYLDGTQYKGKEVTIKGSEIKDLRVVELPRKGKKGKKKKEEGRRKENGETKDKERDSGESSSRGTPSIRPSLHLSRNDSGIDWDTENVHEVKKMDDFDFATNLLKFDKASVFKDISKHDSMSPSDRLVSINKVNPEDRKYGNDEMVIKKHKDEWDSIDGRSTSGSNIANASSKKTTPGRPRDRRSNNARVASASVDRFVDARENSNQRQSSYGGSTPVVDNHVRLVYSDSRETVPTCSQLQLSEIENLAADKFHFSRKLLAENAARGVAQLIISKVLGTFRVGSSNHNTPPLVLALVGNNRAGSIALATGRQLFNHGVRVIAYLLHDFQNSEEELISEVQDNLDTFEACGGKVVSELQSLEALLGKLDSPLEFILDGLQGYDTDLNDFIEPELSDSKEIVDWCNEQDLPVMSIDIPSGLNASSGTSDFGTFLVSKYLVSIGLTLNSVLNLYKFGYFQKSELTHFVVDSGLPKKVFGSKSTFRKFERQWFSNLWSAEIALAD
ncbi:DEKNAAC104204 [Brettanomyces naardenensis]|uniref:Enhancer of mRNA-decapping protein 3 n=1 Tax=Brettanomyces naardenensis TaxID=13370 RepID=A0A448YQ81_BRENA|nr:DEKNAAC104204 [Brettanomyces naardenensis]